MLVLRAPGRVFLRRSPSLLARPLSASPQRRSANTPTREQPERVVPFTEETSVKQPQLDDDLLDSLLKESPTTFDITNRKVYAETVMTDTGTLYDCGTKSIFRSPRPLEENRSSIFTTGLLLAVAEEMQSLQRVLTPEELHAVEQRHRVEAKDLVVRMESSGRKLSEPGSLVPTFEKILSSTEGNIFEDMTPEELCTAVIHDAYERMTPIRARLLSDVPAGFNVALGCRLGFMPLTQLLPFSFVPREPVEVTPEEEEKLREDEEAQWAKWARKLVGRELWVMVIGIHRGMGTKTWSPLVSHRMVPDNVFLLPEIKHELNRRRPKHYLERRWSELRRKT